MTVARRLELRVDDRAPLAPDIDGVADPGLRAPNRELRRAAESILGVIDGTITAPEHANEPLSRPIRRVRPAEKARRPQPSRPPADPVPAPALPELRSEEYRDVVGAPPSLLVMLQRLKPLATSWSRV